jgi:hypothetical protein
VFGSYRWSAHSAHIVPRSAGGRDAVDNIVGACPACNVDKGPRSLLLYLLAHGTRERLMDVHDIFREAEQQMAEHELDIFRRLFAVAARHVPIDATAPEVHQAIEKLILEDPEARELAERLGLFDQFRRSEEQT